ncbi:MAG TPA: hypothetical protein VD997_08610 [Phycisphaerales bacterium]|nr:hypothetical protein [Phycisphaerales bacterium]
MSSWLPITDSGFDAFYLNFKTLIAANPTNYGLQASDGTALAADYTAWHNAYLAATQETTRTKATVATKNTQKRTSMSLVRGYAAQIRVNRAVTEALKIGLGLHIPDTTPSVIPPPATKPVLSIARIEQGSQQVRATDEATPNKRSRPVGSAGMLLYRAIATDAVNDPAQATFVGFVGRPDFTCEFTSADRGKTVTYFARWTNAKGQTGPWSQGVSSSIAA